MIKNGNSNVGKQVTSNITWSIEALKNTPYSETLSISNTGVVSPGRYEGEARIKATFESYLGSTTTTLVIYCGTSGSDYLPNLIEINGSGQKFCSSKVTNKIRFLFNNPSMI